jgi:AcrR family transcriptional regulator
MVVWLANRGGRSHGGFYKFCPHFYDRVTLRSRIIPTIQNELLLASCTIKHLEDDLEGNLKVSYGDLRNPHFAPVCERWMEPLIGVNTPKRTRLSPEARREQLVEIGARLFAERPFNEVWIEQVAQEAGVSRGLIYHYFPNKSDFFSAIVRHGMRHAFDLTAPDKSLPPEKWLVDGVERLVDFVEANADAFRAVFAGRHSVDEDVRAAVRENRDRQVGRITALLSPDEPPSETMRLGVEGWIAMLDAMLLEWLDGRRIERDLLIRLACGSLIGTVVTALTVDGNTKQIERIRHLAPAVFGDR